MIVLITGCRSGFGLLMAQRAAEAGHTVYAGLRDLSTGDALREATAGRPVHLVQLDITKAEEREAVISRILDEHGRIDGLINNAGVPMGGFIEQVAEAELRKVMEVNFFGTVALTQLVLPAMREQRSGAIINISSMSGRMAIPGLGAYAASKFALEGLTEALRHEMALWGVRVINLQPGPYKTDITGRNRRVAARSADLSSPWGQATHNMETVYESNFDSTAGDPDEVARLAVAMLSKKKPPFRVPMGKTSSLRVMLSCYLPFGVLEFVLRRVLKLEPGPMKGA